MRISLPSPSSPFSILIADTTPGLLQLEWTWGTIEKLRRLHTIFLNYFESESTWQTQLGDNLVCCFIPEGSDRLPSGASATSTCIASLERLRGGVGDVLELLWIGIGIPLVLEGESGSPPNIQCGGNGGIILLCFRLRVATIWLKGNSGMTSPKTLQSSSFQYQ